MAICEICGMKYEDIKDPVKLLLNSHDKCPFCEKIIELQNHLIEHWQEFKKASASNPIELNNMTKGKDNVYSLDEHVSTFSFDGRTPFVKEMIEEIAKARKYLYEVVEPYMIILKSLYETKDSFWKEGGNLHYYVRNSSIQFVAIRLKEYLKSDSKYSISKIKNKLVNNKKILFDHHHIFEIVEFKKTGDIIKTEFPHFNIIDYLNKLDKVLEGYSKTIDAIIDYRDNQFAHIGNLKMPIESPREFTYINTKRIFNSLKIIYDGFYYSLAPDLYTGLHYDFNIWFDHLNQITKK